MKTKEKFLINLLICIFLSAFCSVSTFSQAPDQISYQAVVRDANSNLVVNSNIGIRISILKDANDGASVYTETQIAESNDNGLISIAVGSGSSSDVFSNIDWSDGPYFIKTEIDKNGGTNYTITAVSQLLSVPYAIHSKTAENVPIGGGLGDLLYWDGTEWAPISPGKNRTALILCNGVPKWGGCDDSDKPIFRVENKNDINVLAVYTDGVVITADETIGNKSGRGGFAVGGFTTNKEDFQDFLVINQDSARVYIREENDADKSGRGGFAVGGFTTNKEGGIDLYFQVTSDTTYVSTTLFAGGDLSVSGDVNLGGSISSVPVVETIAASGITSISANLGGVVVADNGSFVFERGIYYSVLPDPINTGIKIPMGEGLGTFLDNVLGLSPGTNYYFVAYATNSKGIAYGTVISFMTLVSKE
ncbi:MAG: hypothetical protein KGZ97_08450 [Bacteroidetes bacterium]|nr:hypothetical protein [Bacteroidota bacterium]